MSKTIQIEARALVDLDSDGIKCGQIVTAEEKVIKSLADAGVVDATPEAVAYAKSTGEKPQPISKPEAAIEQGQAIDEGRDAA